MQKSLRKAAIASSTILVLTGALAWSSLAENTPKAVPFCAERRLLALEASRGAATRPCRTLAETKPARVLAHFGLGKDGVYRESALVEFSSSTVGSPLSGTVEFVENGRVLLRATGGLLLEYAGLTEVLVKPGHSVAPGELLGLSAGPVEVQAEKGGRLLDPVALFWPEMSRFSGEAERVEKERRRLVEVLKRSRSSARYETKGGAKAVPTNLKPLFERTAEEVGIDPRLLEAVAAVESGFNPRAVSPKGALGLMQLMPDVARSLGVSDPFDPAQNIRAGARYLRNMLDRFGDLQLALAAYNAGPAAVEKYGGVPPYPETQNYVRKVMAAYAKTKPTGGENL